MIEPGSTSAIVLAGGRSSRFGSSKLDADLAGMTVLDRTIGAVARAATEVLVVGRSSTRGQTARAGVRFVEDRSPFEGPLAGLAAGLALATRDAVIVVGGDMPLVQAGVLDAMLGALVENGDIDAVALEDGGVSRPLPMALRRVGGQQAAAAASTAHERSLRQLMARMRVESIPEATWRQLDPDGDTVLDIDTTADLERARARLSG